jgi:Protein of unknown function (DUF2752)
MIVIVPAPLQPTERFQQPGTAGRALTWWVRSTLVLLAIGMIAVFGTARWLNPYEANGQPRHLGTHQQLGLPACAFYFWTGLPCPSCGMTTSFAFLAHGDLGNSVKANAAGTLLAAFLVLLLPWCLASAVRGRALGVYSVEQAMTRVVGTFMVVVLVRWFLVLGWTWMTK